MRSRRKSLPPLSHRPCQSCGGKQRRPKRRHRSGKILPTQRFVASVFVKCSYRAASFISALEKQRFTRVTCLVHQLIALLAWIQTSLPWAAMASLCNIRSATDFAPCGTCGRYPSC